MQTGRIPLAQAHKHGDAGYLVDAKNDGELYDVDVQIINEHTQIIYEETLSGIPG